MVDDIKKAMIRKFAKKTKKSLPLKKPEHFTVKSGVPLDKQKFTVLSKPVANTSKTPKETVRRIGDTVRSKHVGQRRTKLSAANNKNAPFKTSAASRNDPEPPMDDSPFRDREEFEREEQKEKARRRNTKRVFKRAKKSLPYQAVFDKTRAKGKAVSEAEKHDSAVKRQTDKKTTRKKLVVADKHTAKTIASNKRLATEDKMRARSKTAKTRGEAFKAVGAATRDSQAKFDKALINARKSFYKAQQALGALQAGFDEDKKKRKVRNIERAIKFRRRQGARSGFKPAALTTGELLERSPTNANSQLSRKAAGVQMFKKQFKRGVAGGNRMFRHMRKMF